MKKFPFIKINVYKIDNNFFGTSITVAGLITGKDLSEQLSALCISYDMNIRKDLRDICIKDIKDVESLHSLYVRLERNVL